MAASEENVESVAFNRMTTVFKAVFKDEDITVGLTATAKDVHGWDSIRHVQLILALEEEFNIQFPLGELQAMKNVGDLLYFLENN